MPKRIRRFPATLTRLLAAFLLLLAAPVPAQDDALEQARELRYEQPERAIERLDGAIETLDPDEDRARLAELVEMRAGIARDLGRHQEARRGAERLVELARALDDPVAEGRALHLKGTVQAERGQIAAALETFHEARRVLEDTGATAQRARVLLALGVAHSFTKDYERSREYNQQALPLARKAGDKRLQARILGNMAIDASNLDNPGDSLTLHRQALALSRELDDTRGIAYQLANMCDRLVELGRTREAEDTCLEAIDKVRPLGHPRIRAGTRMTLGDLRLQQRRPGEALTHYHEALDVAEGEVPVVEREVLGKIADLHASRGEHAQALEAYKRMVEVRDQMLDRERREKIEELEARYRADQREREIELLELESQLQSAKLERRTWILVAVSVALVLAMLLALVAWRGFRVKAGLEQALEGRNRELEEALATIRQLAREDPLTELYNRRALFDIGGHEMARAKRDSRPLTVFLADIDEFKPVNDLHGHAIGDEVLKEIARRLKAELREKDVLCRWGGEEFVALLSDTDPDAARQTAERARQAIAAEPVTTETGDFDITMTFGVASVADDLDEAINEADRAMYEGKRAGRNRVVVHDNS